MKTTVIFHSADFDGLFCREIARKFLPDAVLIGWDFADKPLEIPDGQIYILDLPVDRVFGVDFKNKLDPDLWGWWDRIIWIDHHKSAIDSHPSDIPGYRIDGVAACRLAWQWFYLHVERGTLLSCMPDKQEFIDRDLIEPLAVRLAGEYDIWDKRDPRAEVLQFGLRSEELDADDWGALLDADDGDFGYVDRLLDQGKFLQRYQQSNDKSIVEHKSYLMPWEGLTFLCLNTARFNSLTFASKDVPETGHDALCGYSWNGSKWTVSLYHANHRKDLDLSVIAVKHGGGGHRGACGFTDHKWPFTEV